MVNKQQVRSEAMKNNILSSAGKLFAEHGFESVTMREIASKAGCSHTTIYIYFKDKEALLHELAAPLLQELQRQISTLLLRQEWTADIKLKEISKQFTQLCLENRNMHTLLFVTKATRVDEQEPELEINRMRIDLFELLKQALHECLLIPHHETLLLKYTRIFFYLLHGIVGTYIHSEETAEALIARLGDTFDEAIDVFLEGSKQKLRAGVE